MQDTNSSTAPLHLSTEAELNTSGYGQMWERNSSCDCHRCRNNYYVRRKQLREDVGPKYNPVRPVDGVMSYAVDAAGCVTPVLFECRECVDVPSQLDIC